jgi:CubicO group peptidase (beta-lactamase class C family)
MRMSRRALLGRAGRTAIGLSILPLASRAQPGGGQARLANVISELQAEIPALLSASRIPGFAIAIVREGRVVWTQGFGVRSSVSGGAVGPDTLFQVGSISKTVFAYAVMKLIEKRVLDLDTPLVTYVPERWVTGDPRFDRITARHVLSHTSGLQNWRSTKEPLRIASDPGSKWDYSGEGYSFLQLVVSRLAGRVDEQSCEKMYDGAVACATDFDGYMQANLLEPFGMADSRFVWSDVERAAFAQPHDMKGALIDRPAQNLSGAARYGAAGGLVTNVIEYAKFLIEVLDPKPQDAFRLSRESRAEMLRPQTKVDEATSWALGWHVWHNGKLGDLWTHGGDNPGYKAYVVTSPQRQSGYVMMTNGDNFRGIYNRLVTGDSILNRFVAE